MVSIQEILRDAQSREEQDKLEAEKRLREEEQRRIAEVRLRQEQEAARLRAEDEERQRRAHEEERRQAELAAIQEAAITRARSEAEAQARLAEMTARQEHERQLHAVSHDGSKRRLQIVLAVFGVLLFGLAIGGGIMIKGALDKANAAEARASELETEKAQVEAQQRKLQEQLASATSPEERTALLKQLDDAKRAAMTLAGQISAQRPNGPTAGRAPSAPVNAKPQTAGQKPACNCTPGDPLCSCL